MSRIDDILNAAEEARQNKPNLDTSEGKEVTTALYQLLKQKKVKGTHLFYAENISTGANEEYLGPE